jgi:hypothetical protein
MVSLYYCKTNKQIEINTVISYQGTELNIENFARGIYYLSVVNESNETIHKKIILE